MAPWALLLPLAVGIGRRDSTDRRLSCVSWVWLIGTIVFFSLSASKRSAYLMPVAPAVALLSAAVVERLYLNTLDPTRRRIVLGLLVLASLTLLGAGWAGLGLRDRYPDHAGPLLVASAVTIAGALAILGSLSVRDRERRAPLCFLAVLVVMELGLAGWLMPYANGFKSARGFAAATAAVVGDDRISGYRLWVWRADYPYYLGRRIGRVETPEEAGRSWAAERRSCMIVEEWNRKEFLEAVGPALPVHGHDIGSKHVELYCNR